MKTAEQWYIELTDRIHPVGGDVRFELENMLEIIHQIQRESAEEMKSRCLGVLDEVQHTFSAKAKIRALEPAGGG